MKRLCLEAPCPRDATYRGYCRTHAAKRNRETSPNASFYASRRWRLLRRSYLFEHPFCECQCGELAEDVHHRTPIERGGDKWSKDNLEALAHGCHSRVTRQEQMAEDYREMAAHDVATAEADMAVGFETLPGERGELA